LLLWLPAGPSGQSLRWPAWANLLSPTATRESLAALGLPPVFSRVVPVPLPLAELVVAVLLFVPATGRPGAAAALGLLTAFSVVLVAALARGRRPACNCFGASAGSVISWRTIGRNLVLALMAVVGFFVGPASSPRPGPGADVYLAWVLLAMVVALIFLVGQLWGQNRSLLGRLEELGATEHGRRHGHTGVVALAPGARAPSFTLPDASGRPRALEQLLSSSGDGLTVLFVDTGCTACGTALAHLAEQGQGPRRVVVLVTGEAGPTASRLRSAGSDAVVLQSTREVALGYGVVRVPAAVALDGRDG